jgi:hypothetical protein
MQYAIYDFFALYHGSPDAGLASQPPIEHGFGLVPTTPHERHYARGQNDLTPDVQMDTGGEPESS